MVHLHYRWEIWILSTENLENAHSGLGTLTDRKRIIQDACGESATVTDSTRDGAWQIMGHLRYR
jgi:hypothetical protein